MTDELRPRQKVTLKIVKAQLSETFEFGVSFNFLGEQLDFILAYFRKQRKDPFLFHCTDIKLYNLNVRQ